MSSMEFTMSKKTKIDKVNKIDMANNIDNDKTKKSKLQTGLQNKY
jgi:hypothetical protein